MSAIKRIISGGTASTTRLVVLLLFQIALVPVYLRFWTSTQYASWLTIQAIFQLLITVDNAHQNYLQAQFLKISSDTPAEIFNLIKLGKRYVKLIGVVQLSFVAAIFMYERVATPNNQPAFLREVILQAPAILPLLIVWSLVSMPCSVDVKALSAMGKYDRFAWWSVVNSVSVVPSSAVVSYLGGTVWDACAIQSIMTAVYDSAQHRYAKGQLKELLSLNNQPPLLERYGRTEFLAVALYAAKNLVDTLKSTGIRILLVPLVGLGSMANFSTIRTGSNVIAQGIGSLIWPIAPEINRLIQERKYHRITSSVSFMYMAISLTMIPAALVSQYFFPSIYVWWTNGAFKFDALTFSILSSAVICTATSLPALTICTGQNAYKGMFNISVVSAVTLLLAMYVLIPTAGILGAAWSLLCAELTASTGYFYLWLKLFRERSIPFPIHAVVWGSLSAVGGIFILLGFSHEAYLMRTSLVLFGAVVYLGALIGLFYFIISGKKTLSWRGSV